MSKNKARIIQCKFLKGILLSSYWFFTDYVVNHIVSHIPFWQLRKIYYYLCGGTFKNGTQADMDITFMGLSNLNVGSHTHINRNCLIDARGGLLIGNNVSISQRVSIITGSHNMRSPNFEYTSKKIQIDDYVWIGANATILGGVHVGEGSIVCAGAVVTKNVDPYTVVAGVPAMKIMERPRELSYIILKDNYSFPHFT